MRSEYKETKTSTRFPIGSIVKCTNRYVWLGGVPIGISNRNHPRFGELYKVIDCYFYSTGEFIDIRSMDDTYENGGWFCSSFELGEKSSQPEPEILWRRISL